jgi:hypothetical protein
VDTIFLKSKFCIHPSIFQTHPNPDISFPGKNYHQPPPADRETYIKNQLTLVSRPP